VLAVVYGLGCSIPPADCRGRKRAFPDIGAAARSAVGASQDSDARAHLCQPSERAVLVRQQRENESVALLPGAPILLNHGYLVIGLNEDGGVGHLVGYEVWDGI